MNWVKWCIGGEQTWGDETFCAYRGTFPALAGTFPGRRPPARKLRLFGRGRDWPAGRGEEFAHVALGRQHVARQGESL